MRQPGYYWCKYDGEWTVAHYVIKNYGDASWIRIGSYDEMIDEDFSEIDERRIERQPTDEEMNEAWKKLYGTNGPF